jgi:predicted metal-dependent HD superfamily phosphohydrolase
MLLDCHGKTVQHDVVSTSGRDLSGHPGAGAAFDVLVPLMARDHAKSTFVALLTRLAVPAPACRQLEMLWNEPHRHYHTAGHAGLLWYRHMAHGGDPDDAVIAHAIAYHDAIYRVGATDNEACSARLWLSHASALPRTLRDAVECAIIATSRHAAEHDDPRSQWMVDLDLTTLGEPWPLFEANTLALQREAPDIPLSAMRAGQRSFLGSLAALPILYRGRCYGPMLSQTYEATARKNLARVIAG